MPAQTMLARICLTSVSMCIANLCQSQCKCLIIDNCQYSGTKPFMTTVKQLFGIEYSRRMKQECLCVGNYLTRRLHRLSFPLFV